MEKLKVGMIVFPDLTVLDFVGPYEVFVRAKCMEVVIVGETADLIKAEGGLTLKADSTLQDCPGLDIIFVPGGRGVNALLTNTHFLEFLAEQGKKAKYVTSVCTGSLLLAAAGVLEGYKATTHWRSIELLKMFGVEAVEKRVVIDRNRITGGGVTAGIDFGLLLVFLIGGEKMAKIIQLQLEYNPSPPFNAGSPKTIEKNLLEEGIQITQPMFDYRKTLIEKLVRPPV